VRLVEDLDQGAALGDAVDEGDAVEHRTGGAIPLRDDQDVAGPELVDGLFEFGTVSDCLAGGFLAKDDLAARSAPSWRSRFWLGVETLAYPILRIELLS
jgi:hypothetical protein